MIHSPNCFALPCALASHKIKSGYKTTKTVNCSQCFFLDQGGGQTNILRKRGGRRLQLKCIKYKLAKAQGGQNAPPPLKPPRKNSGSCLMYGYYFYAILHVIKAQRELTYACTHMCSCLYTRTIKNIIQE